ncbi:hypothetical protein PHJA_000781800, partial [Phtheirospermum japonicum]
RIVKQSAIDPDRHRLEVIRLSGQTLLKASTNKVLIDSASHRLEEIDICSAEGEIHIAEECLEKLSPQSYDDQYVLKRNSQNRVMNKNSRLGCQVVLSQELDTPYSFLSNSWLTRWPVVSFFFFLGIE